LEITAVKKPALRPATYQNPDQPIESDIREIRRPAALLELPTPMPYAASSGTCELLAKMAHEHASGEQQLARRACEDAMLMIEQLADSRRQSDRALAANAAFSTGEVLLTLHEAHRAKSCFEIAAHYFDSANDIARAARARLGLANALLTLGDPSARAMLEDAGELFEDLGDEQAVIQIDLALRQAQADFDESPRSFHSSSHMRVAKRV
jgi:hypothetical protein